MRCKGCGEALIPKHHNQQFCSTTCRIAWYAVKSIKKKARLRALICIVCGDEFNSLVTTAKYCSSFCHSQYLKSRRKNPGANEVTGEQKIRFSILARDGFRCRYCGRTPSDGIKLVIDHIVPIDKGGTGQLHNLITACMECNLGKSALLLLTAKGQIPTFITLESLASLPEIYKRGNKNRFYIREINQEPYQDTIPCPEGSVFSAS